MVLNLTRLLVRFLGLCLVNGRNSIMYNVGYQAMKNLALPKEQAPKKITGTGLLALNTMGRTKQKKEQDVRERVAGYVTQIRKARMDLKND